MDAHRFMVLYTVLAVAASCQTAFGSLGSIRTGRGSSVPHSAGVTCRPVPDPDMEVPPFSPPYTAPDIPLDYKQQPPGATDPEQIALFPAAQDGSWVFVRYILPHGSQQEPPRVLWGADPENLINYAWPDRTRQYKYGKYTSGRIVFTLLGPLAPSQRYWYRVEGRDSLFHFISFPAPGDQSLHIAIVGDVGQTFNSTTTLRNVLLSPASLVLFAGDLTYADRYGPPCAFPAVAFSGRSGGESAKTGSTSAGISRVMLLEEAAAGSLSHEEVTPGIETMGECGVGGLRWDSWGRMAEDTFAFKVGAFVAGNHELELEPSWGEMEGFKAYRARTPPFLRESTPPAGSDIPAKAPLFYSLDVGPAHVIRLSSYSSFSKYSHQWLWLQQDLCTVNRILTPWLIVFMHVPLYNTNVGHYMEGEAMRLEFEDWLHEAGADLVIAGHTHAYERSHPVHRTRTAEDGCAATYVTVGDGGNIEKIDGPFLEPQPAYSAHREDWFGHAELVIDGQASSAKFIWYRNTNGAQVGDSFFLENQAINCGRSMPSFC